MINKVTVYLVSYEAIGPFSDQWNTILDPGCTTDAREALRLQQNWCGERKDRRSKISAISGIPFDARRTQGFKDLAKEAPR